jgi:hypothetical protein
MEGFRIGFLGLGLKDHDESLGKFDGFQGFRILDK